MRLAKRDGATLLEIDLPSARADEVDVWLRGDDLFVSVRDFERRFALPGSLGGLPIADTRWRDGVLEVRFAPPRAASAVSAPSASAQRIVSLVPSLTEALFELGLGARVVGVTDWCVHPAAEVAHLPKVGGTKNPSLARVLELRPDLVIANQEENRERDVERLRAAGIAVWVTYPRTVADGVALVRELAQLGAPPERAQPLIRALETAVERARAARARAAHARLLSDLEAALDGGRRRHLCGRSARAVRRPQRLRAIARERRYPIVSDARDRRRAPRGDPAAGRAVCVRRARRRGARRDRHTRRRDRPDPLHRWHADLLVWPADRARDRGSGRPARGTRAPVEGRLIGSNKVKRCRRVADTLHISGACPGPGSTPARCTSLARRPRLLAALAAAAALCVALPALAAQITDVRVGVHPKYTRIVFELDGRAGYQVERVGTDAAPELRITIEAMSSARELRANGDIRGVKVDAGTKARAHIALRQPGLRVHEMMLSDPPRIVIDLHKPETAVAATAKPAPKPKAAAKETPAPAPAPKVAAKELPRLAPAPKVVAKETPKPARAEGRRPKEPKPTEPAPKPSREARAGSAARSRRDRRPRSRRPKPAARRPDVAPKPVAETKPPRRSPSPSASLHLPSACRDPRAA